VDQDHSLVTVGGDGQGRIWIWNGSMDGDHSIVIVTDTDMSEWSMFNHNLTGTIPSSLGDLKRHGKFVSCPTMPSDGDLSVGFF
jgi:hypothetical protein